MTDIATRNVAGDTLATELTISDAAGVDRIPLMRDDLVFFTNGLLTQNATMGDTDTAPKFNRDTKNRGCFTVWESLAARAAQYCFVPQQSAVADLNRRNLPFKTPAVPSSS